MLKVIHPVVHVTAGFFLIILLQTAGFHVLLAGAVATVSCALCAATGDWLRIVRRLRYIFLVLLILFAWQTPGTLMLPLIGVFSPTWDGLSAVREPALRLLAVVSVVALMLKYLSTDDWVSSLYVLVSPLRVAGVRPERFAVRLRLVLDYAGQRDLNWRHCLDVAEQDWSDPQDEAWPVRAVQIHDVLALLGLIAVAGGYWLW
ncbi:hypothetical protein Q9Q94_09660 [Uliginosibacterium sp. 31-16]|uniref:hypothetical protein n=1 Tax=Uliginosibacterium sp. 31-16 TaxID=3068315 RepID=UPI00273F355B|nr:hypothetical protein [Uliginosibacterium sp. 31-16]MDP5239798.1 hypothetical protein [Uliginosibacterium sp. 31-16]